MSAVLNSWKEIAVFLHRGVRTTQRWEREADLPVHRVGNREKPPVFAFPAEIEGWLRATPAGTAPWLVSVSGRASAVHLEKPTLQRHRKLRLEMRSLLQIQQEKKATLRNTLETVMVTVAKTVTARNTPSRTKSAGRTLVV